MSQKLSDHTRIIFLVDPEVFSSADLTGSFRLSFHVPWCLRRVQQPDDIAALTLFLASDASRFITGQVIVADGGVMIADPF